MTELEFKLHIDKLNKEIEKYMIDLTPEQFNSTLDLPPEALLGSQFDATLDEFIASSEPETVLGPNVLSFDQNKRRKAINHRIYQNNAKVIAIRADKL
jgi:hypothetical protein